MPNKPLLIHERPAETAKKVRTMLKSYYPNTKFSVKSGKTEYTTFLQVSYLAGDVPNVDEVTTLCKNYQSCHFGEEPTQGEGYQGPDGKWYYGAEHIMYKGAQS